MDKGALTHLIQPKVKLYEALPVSRNLLNFQASDIHFTLRQSLLLPETSRIGAAKAQALIMISLAS